MEYDVEGFRPRGRLDQRGLGERLCTFMHIN